MKQHTSNLFSVLRTQTNSLSNEAIGKTLNGAIKKAKTKYNGTLANT
ncbi:hypothetical protein [Maribacter antarcticus]|nr:hypothetical protein [Maribacter antarcticus]